jgi:replication factor C subunit 2/4
MFECSIKNQFMEAYSKLNVLILKGYSPIDIITTISKVARIYEKFPTEKMQLEYIKEIGLTHIRISDGLSTKLQLTSLVAKLCLIKK